MATLTITNAGGEMRQVRLVKRVTSIGTDPQNDVTLDDTTLPATALHIHFDGRDFNAASHEGVDMSVNGKRKIACRLTPGDVIRVASTEMAFSAAETAASASPGAPPGNQLEAMRGLVGFSERLLAATDLGALLEELLDALVTATHADKGFLILLEGGELSVRAARNLARENIEDAVARVSDSIVQRVALTKKALVVADALHDTQWSGSSSVVNLKLCSVLCAPLMEKGEVFGVIYLGNDNVVNLFTEADLATLTVFTAQASLLVQNAMLVEGLQRDNQKLRGDIEAMRYGDIIGASAAMKEVYRRIDKVAGTDVSVLITGETGTGKELIAREIHRRSPRRDGPLVSVNCGAIPENLLESELFGHVKGAFTGAVATRPGKFQAAGGGTLFLDEIGEMPPQLQVKILRGLQERTVTKVGDTRPEVVDIRIIAATNKVLEQEILRGAFREDLYYRLNVVSLPLPPLRARGDDIPAIAKYFLGKYAKEFEARVKGFSAPALAALRKYAWPGNIRELENRIKKAVVLAERSLITPEDLDLKPEDLDPIMPLLQAKEEFQKRYINEVLERNGGNRTKTARDLGVDPRTIFRHLEAERRGEEQPDGGTEPA
jgi:transcriptional regulator with GAF, ATPase, and Fis domain